jgi:hypothetical protein
VNILIINFREAFVDDLEKKDIINLIKTAKLNAKIVIPSKEEVNDILNIVRYHFLRHSLMLGDLGKSFLEIRNESFKEIIRYCGERKLADTLYYLYNEWYNLKDSEIWMRSSREDYVCRFRTSMFAESHFRILKRDYFSMFGRPVQFFFVNLRI